MSSGEAWDDSPRLRVCLLIRQLNLGGAQRQLLALARGLDPERYQVTVLTFYPGGAFADDLAQWKHIDVRSLNKKGRWETLGFYLHAVSALRRLRPEVIYSFMGGANLLAAACRPWLGKVRVFWGVRSSGLELQRYHWPERMTARLEAWFSFLPHAIICNSDVGMSVAAARGFAQQKLHFIPNGIDEELFHPAGLIQETRSNWGRAPGEIVLGLVGRADPMKDHATGFLALKILRQRGYSVYLQVVGYGSAENGRVLQRQAEALNVADWCGWEALRQDMPSVYSAFDVLVSCSAFGEGFPNVVAEAMACGTPCVVTTVGDAALLVGDLGEVVPPRDALALADGIQRLLSRLQERPALRQEVRASILDRFSIAKMVEETEKLFRENCAGVEGRGTRCV